MTYSWKTLPLSAVAEIVGGGTPSTKAVHYWDGNVPWITPKDLSGYESVFISVGSRSITEEGLNRSSAKLIPANSVLYTSRAPIGYVVINLVPVATNQGFKSLVPKKGFDSVYLYYLLKNSKKEILAYSSGGTFAEISAAAIAEVELPFPPLGAQKAIGNILLDLDAKIEANRNAASILEQIAQTLFRSWFVDFDPVHAKARGAQPEGMDAETAALFPDSFGDSDLGQIPAGWMTDTLGNLVVPKKGKVITKSQTSPGQIPVVAGGLGPAYFHDTPNVEGPVVTVSSSGANAGFVRLYTEDIWASDCTYVSGEETEILYFWYLFLRVRQAEITHMQHGGAQPHIYASDLMRLRASFPVTTDLLRKFHETVVPLYEAVKVKTNENTSLAEMRDSLLPKLISGELEISEQPLGK
jgi:type I restriction enzyme S subunit